MIVYCSDLPNDQDMIRALGSVAIPASLLYGDCAFFGVGDSDEPVRVCVERKKVSDMANCILTNRYLSQIQSASDASFDVLCLIIEDRYRCSPVDGLLETLGYNQERQRGGWKPVTPSVMFSRFDQYLTEVDYLAGVIVKRSEDVRGTADIIKSLYVNFQTPPRDHQSLKAVYKQPRPVLLRKPSLVRRIASELPGIGWERSGTVAEHFSTVAAMVGADVKEWATLDGIGKKTAEKVVQAIGGDTD